MNLLGVHLIPAHMRPEDFEYTISLQAGVVKIINPDPSIVQRIYPSLPDALYFLRDHAMSEQHDDAYSQPEMTGMRHAREWNERIRNFGVPLSQVVMPGINEPHVWSHLHQTIRYYVAFLDACTGYGIRGAALNLSVGWPANLAEGAPPDWSPYEPLHEAIKRGNHVLCVHEYFDHRGVDFNWGWWCGRILKNTWNVPIIIGECGNDEYVSDPSLPFPNRGWQGHFSPEQYAAQIERYCNRIGADGRVIGVCPFTTDYGGREWASFDTQPAHDRLSRVYVQAGNGSLINKPTPPPVVDEKPTPPPTAELSGLIHPCSGATITQRWGERPEAYAQFGDMFGHNGVDFGTPMRTPILALADGEVAMVAADISYGSYVRLYHPRLRLCSFYAHLDSATVTAGQTVTAGTQIGLSGNTGNSTGPHLHFEVRVMDETGAYSFLTPRGRGRVDPQSICAYLGLKL